MAFYVYILSNTNNKVLYTGITNDLVRRVYEHKHHLDKGSFTARYNVEKLVYFEETSSSREAIAREVYEELGLRVRKGRFEKLAVYDNPGRIAAYRDGSIWRMVIVVYGLDLEEEPEMRISKESKDLRFFSKEEVKHLEIAVTHADIVVDWFTER